MKNNLSLFGFLLLFAIGIVSFGDLWKSEIVQNKKVAKQKNNAVDSGLESPAKKIEQGNISVLPQALDSSSMQNLHDESGEDQEGEEFRRMAGIERRKEIMEERKQYKTARRKWRKSLDQARVEAKVSGDYSAYEAIKKQEPGKD